MLLVSGIDPLTFPQLHLRLYKNDYFPNRESTLGDFVEADFAGYAELLLDRSQWSAPVTTAGRAQTYYGPAFVEWLSTSGSQNVYGYYVTGGVGVVAWAERFAQFQQVGVSTPVLVQPIMVLHSELEPIP